MRGVDVVRREGGVGGALFVVGDDPGAAGGDGETTPVLHHFVALVGADLDGEAGEADVGLVALPLVINDEHVVVSSSMHQPIRQSLVITSHGSGNAAAERFVALLESAEGRETLTRYGFIVEPS